jgi:hypothetical protein
MLLEKKPPSVYQLGRVKRFLGFLFVGLVASLSLIAEDSRIAKIRFLTQPFASAPIPVSANGFRCESVLVLLAPDFERITAQLELPGGSSQELSPDGDRNLSVRGVYDTADALEAAYPSGTYGLAGTDSIVGNFNLTLVLPDTAFPVAPQIVNFTEAQTIDASQDFDLKWNAFTGADPLRDSIFLHIQDAHENPIVYQHVVSPGTKLMTISAKSFEPGKTYYGYLRFTKVVGQSDQSPASYPFVKATFASETRFAINVNTIDGLPVTGPVFRSITSTGTGFITVVVDCKVGAPLSFDSTASLKAPAYVFLLSTNPPVSPLTVTLPLPDSAQGFIRAVEE